MKDAITRQAQLLWKFLGFFQAPPLRCMHALLIVLVLLQALSSRGMSLLFAPFSDAPLAFLSTWYHIIAGIATATLTIAMTAYSFSQRGLRRYFPYLWGDVSRIKKDLQEAWQGKVPAPTAGGLATTVQGLGFGALWLTVFSGLAWFYFGLVGKHIASAYALAIHTFVVNLLILYFIGHGSMALLHFVLWQRKTVQK